MCRLACYYAQHHKLRIYFATIEDPGDHQFCILADKKTKAVNIRCMKDAKGDLEWIVDP